MPVCTSCMHPTPYLYTVYQSATNLRLEQCTACHAFADPYVEHDTLTLLLDLILLKRDVYRHLLFNRGLGGRKSGEGPNFPPEGETPEPGDSSGEKARATIYDRANERRRENTRWWLIIRLGAALITVDAFIRWTHLRPNAPFHDLAEDVISWNLQTVEGFLRILVGCSIETIAFHAGITMACYIVLKSLAYTRVPNSNMSTDLHMSSIRQEFRYSHVPLTLFYSSLTKLFLLFLLSIWRPTPTNHLSTSADGAFTHPVITQALDIFDEDKLDREWMVRNVLGGMAAGFGLRVVLDCHPFFTTTIILTGWGIKTVVASLVSRWVGLGLIANENSGDTWLAYSIP